ncbi:MAG: ABC transporter substrate-binding protein [Chloroflexi bacterium AL-W]|nr:ABC transporter substrate-binding protein [Chloroflexi bacterium AL-N1]NOK70762.1 ABC transporter substrate-binding protein [Chloroflexi bacterium AL-N10]NOK78322.1 ABC transporter substrate-binding protein [Chloroflexi bacterium AL-N5]NOK85665.1 ABC transporter substrate-binding protein [Chloroflexi bacterium AL-W]NOK92579.1 ABC transporter substrate-binding protein [Chloroflexi bacterium AL-N15]
MQRSSCFCYTFTLLVMAITLTACASPIESVEPLTVVETNTESHLIRHVFGETAVPHTPQRVLALGEEGLLLDLLDTGVRPVAASVNVPESVSLVEPDELEGIELFASTGNISLEALSTYQPDLIIGTHFFIDTIGYEELHQMAPTVAIGSIEPLESYRETLTVFGQSEAAQRTIDAFRAQIEAESERVDAANQQVSVATIYSAENVALWFDGPSPIPRLLHELGVQFQPDPATIDGLDIRNGRAFISLEQIPLMSGDTLFLLQSSKVEGENDAVDAIQTTALWQQLPSVQTDQVIRLDRIGYPGLRGQYQLLDDVVQALEGETQIQN